MAAEVLEGKRDYGNYDLKRDARREWIYFLWLRGKKLQEIEEITGWDRVTIWRDIKHIREEQSENPRSIEEVRQEALIGLQLDRGEILERARAAPEKDAHRYFRLAVDINKLILDRFALGEAGTGIVDSSDIDRAKIIIDYMVMKFGPESLDGFEEYYTRRMSMKT